MSIKLPYHERKMRKAVKLFWSSREKAKRRQAGSAKTDRGERSSVTAGKHMEGFISLITDVIKANGLDQASIHSNSTLLTLPGFFRPKKLWDLLVTHNGNLVAAVELKSHVGPSFSNNFNNRVEEAIGTAKDLWTAYREGAFGEQSQPFVGWMILLEDGEKSRKPVASTSPHFPVLTEFEDTSCAERYNILCRKLVQEQLYTAASVILSPRSAVTTGDYSELSKMTGFKMFATELAAHIAATAARR